jgi:hypothetical protein
MAMVSLNKRNGISMLDCETYKSIRYNPFYLPLHKSGLSRLKLTLPWFWNKFVLFKVVKEWKKG